MKIPLELRAKLEAAAMEGSVNRELIDMIDGAFAEMAEIISLQDAAITDLAEIIGGMTE